MLSVIAVLVLCGTPYENDVYRVPVIIGIAPIQAVEIQLVKAQPVRRLVKAQPVRRLVKAQPVRRLVKAQPLQKLIKAQPLRRIVQARLLRRIFVR